MCSIPYVTTSQINNIDYCVSQHYLKHTMLQSKRTIDPTQNSMKTVNKTSRRIRKFFSRPTLGNAATSCKHTLAHTQEHMQDGKARRMTWDKLYAPRDAECWRWTADYSKFLPSDPIAHTKHNYVRLLHFTIFAVITSLRSKLKIKAISC